MSALPAGVSVRELLPEGVHYILPPRYLGDARRRAKLFFMAGSVWTLACLGWAIFLICGDLGKPGWIGDALRNLMESLPFLGIGLMVIGFTSFLMWGHAEIKLHKGKLLAIERAGLLHWTWRQNAAEIHGLKIVPGLGSSSNEAPGADPDERHFRISAGSIFLAAGYPKDLCVALASDLKRQWPKEIADNGKINSPEVSEFAPSPVARPAIVDRYQQPADSRVAVTTSADGNLVLQIPLLGVWKGCNGLFKFALAWNACMALATIGLVIAFSIGPELPRTFMVLAVAGFWVVGVLVLFGALRYGRRRTAIAVADGRLMIIQRFLFLNQKRDWTRDEIESVICGRSMISVGDEQIMELQIWPTNGEKFSALTGRNSEELEWIATLVRQHLSLAPPNGESQRDASAAAV